jgi:hypothetical protein
MRCKVRAGYEDTLNRPGAILRLQAHFVTSSRTPGYPAANCSHWDGGGTVFFTNRRVAGRRLAEQFMRHRPFHPFALGIARGGVPVAHDVARTPGAMELVP